MVAGSPGAALFICVALNLTTTYFLSALPPQHCGYHTSVSSSSLSAVTWHDPADMRGHPASSCGSEQAGNEASGYCTNAEAFIASSDDSSAAIGAVAGTCPPHAWRVEEVRRCSGSGSGCREQCGLTCESGRGRERFIKRERNMDGCNGERGDGQMEEVGGVHKHKHKHKHKHELNHKHEKKRMEHRCKGQEKAQQAHQGGECESESNGGFLEVPGARGSRVQCQGLETAVLAAASEALSGVGMAWCAGEAVGRCSDQSTAATLGRASARAGSGSGSGSGNGSSGGAVASRKDRPHACTSSSAVEVVVAEGEGEGSEERHRQNQRGRRASKAGCVDPTTASEQCLIPFIRAGPCLLGTHRFLLPSSHHSPPLPSLSLAPAWACRQHVCIKWPMPAAPAAGVTAVSAVAPAKVGVREGGGDGGGGGGGGKEGGAESSRGPTGKEAAHSVAGRMKARGDVHDSEEETIREEASRRQKVEAERERRSGTVERATEQGRERSKNKQRGKKGGGDEGLAYVLAQQQQQQQQQQQLLNGHEMTREGAVQSGGEVAQLEVVMSQAIQMVNSGQVKQAIAIFNELVEIPLIEANALIGRGTAYALSGDLPRAIQDYDLVVLKYPLELEGWRRRAQAKMAMHQYKEAIADLTHVIEQRPDMMQVRNERALAFIKERRNWDATSDMLIAIEADPNNTAYLLTLAQSYMQAGEVVAAVEVLQRGLALAPRHLDLLVGLGQTLKEVADLRGAEEAYKRALAVNSRHLPVYRSYASLMHAFGFHQQTLSLVRKGLAVDPHDIDLLYLAASCSHALGDWEAAVRGYDDILALQLSPDSDRVKQFQAFYQKEALLYTASLLKKPIQSYALDDDLSPQFKEHWGKRLPPSHLFPDYEMQPPLPPAPHLGKGSKRGMDDRKALRKLLAAADRIGSRAQYFHQGFVPNRRQLRMAGLAALQVRECIRSHLQVLEREREVIEGEKVVPAGNGRGARGQAGSPDLQVMNGRASATTTAMPLSAGEDEAAATHKADTDAAAAAATSAPSSTSSLPSSPTGFTLQRRRGQRQEQRQRLQQDGGGRSGRVEADVSDAATHDGSSTTSGSSRVSGRLSGSTRLSPCCVGGSDERPRSRLRWRDVYHLVVKWRQIAEPCDPVLWIDKLTREEFEDGFGSVTSMLVGQMKNIRYYFAFHRAFPLMKERMVVDGVWNGANVELPLTPLMRQQIAESSSAEELWNVVKQDFWVVTPCHSTARPGVIMNGTRLTMIRTPSYFDFAIKTPGTPARWAEYDLEMQTAFEELCDAIMDRATQSVNTTAYRHRIHMAALRLAFYWYNFMPLSRGTAMAGYVTLLGFFLSADMEVTASIPQGVQADWEGILRPHLHEFQHSLAPWLLPSINYSPSLEELPTVSEALPSLESIIKVLSFQ